MTALDFWFDFASTYSYPAAHRIGALAEDAGVAVRFRPFQLGPIFKAQGWDNSPFNIYEAKGRYMWRDLERLCADLGLPFRRPRALSAAFALGGAHCDRGRRRTLARGFLPRSFPRAIRRRPADLGARRARRAAGRLKIDPAPVLARAQSDDVKNKLKAEGEAAQRIGLFGAPTFVTAGRRIVLGQ